MRVVDIPARAIDYRLNILGVRVWEKECQLIAKSNDEWSTIGPRWDLPVEIPNDATGLKTAAGDTCRLTAYQYNMERPGSDLSDVLAQRKDFSVALGIAGAASQT